MDGNFCKPSILAVCNSNKRTIFQPAILNVRKVFNILNETAHISSSEKKIICIIKPLLLSCRGSDARYLIKILSGNWRVGFYDKIVFRALTQDHDSLQIGQRQEVQGSSRKCLANRASNWELRTISVRIMNHCSLLYFRGMLKIWHLI